MKFEENKMYKNILKDKNTAFIVDEILSKDTTGVSLMVSWYQLNDKNKYTSLGINGEFRIPKAHETHYMEIT